MRVQRFFKVTCKCGHTGSKKNYIPITFPVEAENAREAAQKARWIPRCKHHHKDCIQNVEECSYEQYLELIEVNKLDPYLKCKCIQEQKLLNIEDRYIEETKYLDEKNELIEDESNVEYKVYYYRKKKIKHPKKYMLNIYINQSSLMEEHYYETNF